MNNPGVLIRQCSCEHPDQDNMYGRGKRVFNLNGGKDGKQRKYKCTVCGSTEEVRDSEINRPNEKSNKKH